MALRKAVLPSGGIGVENGADAVFNVTLAQPSAQVVTVAYQTADGTAIANLNYVPASGTLTFQPGETLHTVSVPILADGVATPTLDFTLVLSNPTNAITYPVSVPAASSPPTAVKFFNAAANTGMGVFTNTPTIGVFVPQNSFAGTYTSTLTLSVVSGP